MTTPGLVIRPFTTSDQAATRSLILAGLADHFGTLDERLNPDLNDIAATYLCTGSQFIVAELDGEIVGLGALITESSDTGRIVRMSVARHHRGRGIGRTLVKHLLDAARARGDQRVVVETTDDWSDAIGLYHACGFTQFDHRDGDIHLAIDLI
jgi:GNAT superfamily N-acetyltransferase